jgi:hypothetical protein
MKRHKWKKTEKNKFTEQEECINCGLYRIKPFKFWVYSKEKTTNENPFVDPVQNLGCK